MMRLPRFEVLFPATVEEACSLLTQHGPEARIMGGGTEILAAAKLRNIQPTHIISLKGIDSLRGITYQKEEGLRIGAMTSLHHIRENSLIREHFRALTQAAAAVGSPQIQRMGTLGGNLCLNTRCYFYNQSSGWRRHREVCLKMGGDVCHVVAKGGKCYAVSSADTPPVLIALNAKLRLVSSRGARWISVRDFYTGDGKQPTTLEQNEILTEIRLPPVTEQVSIYLKYRIRKAIDFPLVAVAVGLLFVDRGDKCDQVKIVLNAVGPAPIEVLDVEPLLKNSIFTDEGSKKAAEMAVRAARPVANTAATPTYRRKMAGVLTLKALTALKKGASFQ